MKWIRFEDIKPPIGMNILVITHGLIAVFEWEKKYEEDSAQCVWVCGDNIKSGLCIFDLDGWVPASFFDQYYGKRRFSFDEKDDWYLNNKRNPYVETIKDTIEHIDTSDDSHKKSLGMDYLTYLFWKINHDQ